MFRNMVTSLFKHERIRTTDAKAKEIRRWADKLVTLAKRGDLHARRQALAIIREKDVVHKLFTEAPERFAQVNGGYTRVVKVGFRPGDAAPISMVELVTPEVKKKKARRKKKAKKAAAPSAAAPQTTTSEDQTEALPAADEAVKTADETVTPTAAAADDAALEASSSTDEASAASDPQEDLATEAAAAEPAKGQADEAETTDAAATEDPPKKDA
jgi:large subunit ribosomal protein L17